MSSMTLLSSNTMSNTMSNKKNTKAGAILNKISKIIAVDEQDAEDHCQTKLGSETKNHKMRTFDKAPQDNVWAADARTPKEHMSCVSLLRSYSSTKKTTRAGARPRRPQSQPSRHQESKSTMMRNYKLPKWHNKNMQDAVEDYQLMASVRKGSVMS